MLIVDKKMRWKKKLRSEYCGDVGVAGDGGHGPDGPTHHPQVQDPAERGERKMTTRGGYGDLQLLMDYEDGGD